MKKKSIFAIVFCIFLLISSTLYAETYFVDADRPDDSGSGLSWGEAKQTITAAITASDEGDTILVKYGIYLITSFITISSDRVITSDDGGNESWNSALYDSSQCILSANTSRIFTIISDTVTNVTRIRGLKITGGDATDDTVDAAYGGGILINSGADPIIENCWITKNTANTGGTSYGYGGGLSIRGTGTEPVIQYCRIDSNTAAADRGYGGGIHSDNSSTPLITNNYILYNMGSSTEIGYGGGIYCYYSDAEIYYNKIMHNEATTDNVSFGGSGGGIYLNFGSVKVYENEILYNYASKSSSGYGGGIYSRYGDQDIWKNKISYNIACNGWNEGYGGGLYSGGDQIRNNIITYNIGTTSASANESYRRGGGGGIYLVGSGNTVEYNTITHNIASVYGVGRGGGVASDIAHYKGNIIAYNIASDSSDGYGGGLHLGNFSGTMINNTFYQNSNIGSNLGTGTGTGSQIYNYTTGGSYYKDIQNNIFYGHNLAVGDCTAIFSYVDANMQIKNSCFFNHSKTYNHNVHSENEILGDPCFVYPDTGNFDLQYMSACIDAGKDFYAYNETDNHDWGWKLDIGAREYEGVRVAKAISDTGTYYFGGQVRAKLFITSINVPTEIDITVYPGEDPPNGGLAVKRWYDMDATNEGANFDLTLSYKDSELNGLGEDLLSIWYWTGTGWNNPGSVIDTSTSENWLTISDQILFGNWAISTEDITGINSGDKSELVVNYQLSQNYPNPFNPSTTISYQILSKSFVKIELYNVLGERIKTLFSGNREAGNYTVNLNGSDLPSGVYYYRLKTENFVDTKKCLLLK